MTNRNTNSPHILNTSATLLGLCFIVFTSRNIIELKEASLIDEITAFAIFSFMTSCILSFLSMKSNSERGIKFEKYADIMFFIGLFSLLLTTLLISFDIIK